MSCSALSRLAPSSRAASARPSASRLATREGAGGFALARLEHEDGRTRSGRARSARREERANWMSEQAAPPIAGPQRVGRRAVNERGACGGAAGGAPTALPAGGGGGPLRGDEVAERSEALQ